MKNVIFTVLGIVMAVAALVLVAECDNIATLIVSKAVAVLVLAVCGRAWKLVDEFDTERK